MRAHGDIIMILHIFYSLWPEFSTLFKAAEGQALVFFIKAICSGNEPTGCKWPSFLIVAPGMEVALDTGILTLIDQNCLLPLGHSKYVLIEVPFQRLPLGWNQILFALQLRGFQILLAQPERCDHLMKKRAFFDDMIYSGVYLQVEWGSFLGHHGPEVKSQAEYLAQKGYVHCLATDSHNAWSRHVGYVEDTPGWWNFRLEERISSCVAAKTRRVF